MSSEEKRVILFCLSSEIEAFEKELVRRGGARRDYYGNPQFDTVVAHLKLLESARREVEAIRA